MDESEVMQRRLMDCEHKECVAAAFVVPESRPDGRAVAPCLRTRYGHVKHTLACILADGPCPCRGP